MRALPSELGAMRRRRCRDPTMRPLATPSFGLSWRPACSRRGVAALFWVPSAPAARGYFPGAARRRLHPLRLRALARARPSVRVDPRQRLFVGRDLAALCGRARAGMARRLSRTAARRLGGDRRRRCASPRFVRSVRASSGPCPRWLAWLHRAPRRSRSASSTGRSSAGWRSRVFAGGARARARRARTDARAHRRARRAHARGGAVAPRRVGRRARVCFGPRPACSSRSSRSSRRAASGGAPAIAALLRAALPGSRRPRSCSARTGSRPATRSRRARS